MILQAPAKINLSLEVRGKRPDGFHELESLMVPLTLADTLTLEPAEHFAFTCSDASLPCDDSNLVVRATHRFFETCQREGKELPSSVRIHLEKAIPHGAGLGGGSSDAASTLLGLNEFFETSQASAQTDLPEGPVPTGSPKTPPLTPETLHALAAELGSDVPFFLAKSVAVWRGRGEIVEPIAFPHSLPLLLIKPGFGVPTPWAYSRWRSAKELPGVSYAPQVFPWGRLVNDLERPVFEKYLFLPTLKRWLLGQPEVAGALMSGSGSTSFAVLRDMQDGPALEARVREAFGEVWTCLCLGGSFGN